MLSEEQKGYLQLILYSLMVGGVGVFVRLVRDMDAYSILFFRAIIATCFIFFATIFAKNIKELKLVYPIHTLLVGIFQGLSTLFYFLAIFRTSVSNAIFLIYTAPIFSIIIAKLFFKEKIEKSTIIGLAITTLGIILILNPSSFSFKSTETIGNLFGLASGFFYAVMALTAKPIMKKVSGYYVAFWQFAVISVVFVLFLQDNAMAIFLTNLWQFAIIGIFCTGISFILFMEGVRRVNAQKIFIVTSLEPLMGAALAMLILQQIPTGMTIAGAILILAGIYIVTRQ